MHEPADRPSLWTWLVCGLLLLASTINYMDRQTLANTSTQVMDELRLNNEAYGNLDTQFGYAFAAGSLVFGFIADKVDVRWLYPCVLTLWSLAGVVTGYVQDYDQLVWCRTALGFFEAGHWPCALRTTQRVLSARDRTLGNSVLQSGTSIGAIVTPLIVLAMLTDDPGSWRRPFIVVGCVGMGWVLLWAASVNWSPVWRRTSPTEAAGDSRRMEPAVEIRPLLVRVALLLVVVITINITWHLSRVWLPLFLEKGRGYTVQQRLWITAAYNGFTDVGCIAAGAATVWLHRRGLGVQRSRVAAFCLCSLATAATIAIPWLEKGSGLLAVLFLVAAGSLGLFPCYYTFTQEISARHHGKIFGVLSTTAWLIVSPLQKEVGKYVDTHKQYDLPMALIGVLPLLGAAVLFQWWRETGARPPAESIPPDAANS
jgi:ACS family hexuronate transporter-like MFS transporter